MRLAIAGAALFATLASLASLALRDPSPGEPAPSPPADARPRSIAPALFAPAAVVAPAETADGSGTDPAGDSADDPLPDLASGPDARPSDLALRDSGPLGGPATPPVPPAPASVPRVDGPDRPPLDLVPAPPTSPPGPPEAGPRRFLVRDSKGRTIVTREHGTLKERLAVLLPDGQIGWPDGLFVTDQPFVPVPIGELRQKLQEEEFPTSRVIQTDHYLVFYQGSETFARASADLLEKLYVGLTDTLKKHKIPASPAEFPWSR